MRAFFILYSLFLFRGENFLFHILYLLFRGEHECSLMRVEAADVASALDKLSYEKVSRHLVLLL